jgi:hypothetical protein
LVLDTPHRGARAGRGVTRRRLYGADPGDRLLTDGIGGSGLEGGVVVEKVKALPEGHGLDANTSEYVDMLAAGIIDPAKVTRSALQNAASIAGLFLTTEAVVAEKPEPEKTPATAGAGAGMEM